MVSRRLFISGTASALIAGPALAQTRPLPSASTAVPIDAATRKRRIEKLQGLMRQQGITAFITEAGSSLTYFTGIKWWNSERVTAAVIPVHGEAFIVTPSFEEPSVRETLQIDATVVSWDEHENPEAKMVAGIKARSGKTGKGIIAVEPNTRYFIIDALKKLGGWRVVSGQGLIGACRQIKTPEELTLMQLASDITIEALRQVHAQVAVGMSSGDVSALMNKATTAMGGGVEFSMVLLNEASAYPHGSHQKQSVREGSTILMDCGCAVDGYQSDISRSWVFGEASAKQRKVWDTVKRGQEIALETARIGLPVGRIDDAVRTFYEKEGWGPGYHLPGLSHRTGHGIGLDGHESPYLVHSDQTPLAAGMCFSDEPGLYIPSEFGIRLEDCWHMTESGPKLFTGLARSIDDPI